MPFGLCGAAPVFQRMMNFLFQHDPKLSKEEKELIDEHLQWYIDNVVGHANDKEVLIKVLQLIMKIFKRNHLFCKLSKCICMSEEVDFIGFVVGSKGIGMQEDKIKAIQDWESPDKGETDTKRTQRLQQYLGFGNFYWRFINNYSGIVKPLTNLTRKDVPWIWGNKEQGAFQKLKDVICLEPVLAHPDPNKQYFMEANASGVAIGAIFSQRKDDGKLHPIAFRSQSFKPAEMKYDTFDKELPAVVNSLKDWILYLKGTKFPNIIFADHHNLQYWKDRNTFNQRHTR